MLLATSPDFISEKLLMKYPSFEEWNARNKSADSSNCISDKEMSISSDTQEQRQTPDEAIEANARLLNDQLAEELLRAILQRPPEFFEQLVLDVMQAMGYGQFGAGHVTGGSGDGGIDGIIEEDKLGLEKIYLQAKRYAPDNSVNRPVIQTFVGSMAGSGASKGVFITTSKFSKGAQESARSNPQFRVVLINGQRLAELMIDNNVGVSETTSWSLKRIDSDYFEPES